MISIGYIVRKYLCFILSIVFVCHSTPQNSNYVLDPLPTQILSAYNGRRLDGKWAKVNDNKEVQALISTTTQNTMIGVIQVKLSNWTDHPLFTPSTQSPKKNPDFNPRRRHSRLRSRGNAQSSDYWRPIDSDGASSNSSTYIFQTGNPKDKFAYVDNTYAYVLIAIFLGLAIFLMSLYLFISCRNCCKNRSRRRQSITFPSPYAYYESNPWGVNRRGGDLERLFRNDLENKRPPLVAPPPAPPRIPPPPVPEHLRHNPTYTRRKLAFPPRDSPIERNIRLQMLKRQISESTLSTRTRTNSF